MKKSEKDFGFTTHLRKSQRHQQRKLHDLDYADDIALLETNLYESQKQLDETCKTAKCWPRNKCYKDKTNDYQRREK